MASTSTTAPLSSWRKEGAFSTVRASEIHDARTALFSAVVSLGSLVTSSGCVYIAAPGTGLSAGDRGWLVWKGLNLSLISILRNRGLPAETGRRTAVFLHDQAALFALTSICFC